MLNEKIFMTKIFQIAELKSMQVSKEYVKLLYDLLKGDFTDDEFVSICVHILKNEELYGKMPEPRHFYKHKKESRELTPEQIANSEFSAVLDHDANLHEITNRVLKIWEENGNSIYWRLDPYNDNREEIKWVRKEFIELWLGIHERPDVLRIGEQKNKTYENKPQHISNIIKTGLFNE
jgi:hypothetical protein